MTNPFALYTCRIVLSLTFIGMLTACSQFSTKPGAIGFHNLSARYNAYFMAEQSLAEAEFQMSKAYKENYNELLPILLPLDSVLSLPVKLQLQDAIKKSSIVAEKHQNSKWMDNSYIVLGKSRLYLGEWADGLEALRYVYANGRDENDKNDALILLMRAYTIRKDYSNALGVAEYLSQQPLTKSSAREFYLTKAYLHQQNGEYLTSVAILEETFPLLKKSTETARIHFAAAQMYDRLGQYALANKHYRSVSKNRPGYDLGFYSSMNSLQNEVVLDPKKDLDDVGFAKMLRDRKNDDLRDKIYFTMGLLAEHRKQIPEAIDYLQKSAAASKGTNMEQKAYTYLQLARINYESLEKFEVSKAYYDSALTILPQTAPEYKLVSERKRALDQFVEQYTIVNTEDSLQKLAQMNPAALDNRIDAIIEAQESERKAEEAKAQKALLAAQNTNVQSVQSPLMNGGERRWELYDPALINQGKMDFKRAWGNRPLEDDWRRSSRQMRSLANNGINAPDSLAPTTELVADNSLKKGSPEWDALHASLKQSIPLTEGQMGDSQKRKEDALYNLGKIYRFDLKEQQRSINTFERVLADYPKTQYKEEIYYLLYLTYESENDKNAWKSRLLNEYPTSTYARLVGKTTGNAGDLAGSGNPVKEYEAAYALYSKGDYARALEEIEQNLPAYKGHAIEDKFALLRVFLIGKVRGKEAYTQAITEFMRLYPSSIYLPRLKEMQELNSLSMGKR
ncbi:tetratricopeptide repeat protein [Dyadobacter sp. CY326]|uniref:type IX secretion system periplasmic lipoprotein PorW/SprE n=1 Tax=Dyadobacter sp. CY326 TaxID=2907300 RepID=UPI001F2F0C30|nr:tetratricopeptide repeat protein [Dyadobacter sp. CY326]MCE7066855.1 tetratricopeptide repeat protein [Dyadobacter sp. CY326]